MCGIAGFVDFSKTSSQETLICMTDALSHRGPDDKGYHFLEQEYAHVGMGHRRLSILDLTKRGCQPMVFENITVIYNGEVYNFREIRIALEADGYIFDSNSDTEVLLKAFHKWGPQCLEKLNGMFAFAVYDQNTSIVYLVRDRIGVKPLYYYFKGDLLLFGSELKAFHHNQQFNRNKSISLNGLYQFFQDGFITHPYTIFENTFKVKPGHFLAINLKNRSVTENKYWDISNFVAMPRLVLSEDEVITHLENLIASSCKYRLISDVPVGVFLSGGIDSSLIAAISQSISTSTIKTFTIGFEQTNYNEAIFARDVARFLGTDHSEYILTGREAFEIVTKLPEIYDEPFSDNSAIPTYFLSKFSRSNIKVALSGDAGDELFAGYSGYLRLSRYYSIIQELPYFIKNGFSGAISAANKILLSKINCKSADSLERIRSVLSAKSLLDISLALNRTTQASLKKVLKIKLPKLQFKFSPSSNESGINGVLLYGFLHNLPEILLTKIDRASMAASLEVRGPLLDYRLAEFAFQLPDKLKVFNGTLKYALRKLLYRYVPEQLVERPKMGFTSPYGSWLKNELREVVFAYINEQTFKDEDYFNSKQVVRCRDLYYKNCCNDQTIWRLLTYKMWASRWMN